MSKREELFGRLGKIGSEALISAVNLKRELESEALDRMERLAKRLKLVRREEFETLRDSLKEIRAIQSGLDARLGVVERALGLKKSVGKKSTARKRPAR